MASITQLQGSLLVDRGDVHAMPDMGCISERVSSKSDWHDATGATIEQAWRELEVTAPKSPHCALRSLKDSGSSWVRLRAKGPFARRRTRGLRNKHLD